MVWDLVRDSAFGHVVRFVTKNKIYQYPEEKDPSIAIRYYNTEKTRNMARYGKPTRPEEAKEAEKESRSPSPSPVSTEQRTNNRHDSSGSETTRVSLDHQVSNVTGTKVDPDKGRDVTIVDWDGPDDPENPINWSLSKKLWVTFEICLLTFGIYIGSAIYTAGIEDIVQKFGVSQVAATVGLTLFVAGYGLGMFLILLLSSPL